MAPETYNVFIAIGSAEPEHWGCVGQWGHHGAEAVNADTE